MAPATITSNYLLILIGIGFYWTVVLNMQASAMSVIIPCDEVSREEFEELFEDNFKPLKFRNHVFRLWEMEVDLEGFDRFCRRPDLEDGPGNLSMDASNEADGAFHVSMIKESSEQTANIRAAKINDKWNKSEELQADYRGKSVSWRSHISYGFYDKTGRVFILTYVLPCHQTFRRNASYCQERLAQ